MTLVYALWDGLMLLGTVGVLPLLVGAPLYAMAKGQRRAGWILFVALGVALFVSTSLQWSLGRPRPTPISPMIPVPPTGSFPSGHATLVWTFAVFVSLVVRRWRVAATCVAIAILTCISRVHLQHHFPSDVVVGASIGSGLGAMAYGLVYLRHSEARPAWAWLVWGQLSVLVLATVGAYLGLTDVAVLRIPGIDKVLHFVLFGTFAALLVGWFANRPAGHVLWVLTAVAVFDEVIQAWSPARSFDLLDLFMTLSGVWIMGAIGHRAVRRWRSHRSMVDSERRGARIFEASSCHRRDARVGTGFAAPH